MCTFLNDHIPTVLGEPHWWYNGQNACLEWSRSWDQTKDYKNDTVIVASLLSTQY